MKLLIVFIIGLVINNIICADNFTIGKINDSNVRIREQPDLSSRVLSTQSRGANVSVLGRSDKRVYVDGMNSYWLKVTSDTVSGWVYGGFVNIPKNYSELPVVGEATTHGVIDLNYSRNVDWVSLANQDRKLIAAIDKRNYSDSPEQFAKLFSNMLRDGKNLQPLLLPTIELGWAETDRQMVVASSELADYIQSNYDSKLEFNGPSKINNEYYFWIYGFNKQANFSGVKITTLFFKLDSLNGSKVPQLNKKAFVDKVVIIPDNLKDFDNDRVAYEKYVSTMLSNELSEYSQLLFNDRVPRQ